MSSALLKGVTCLTRDQPPKLNVLFLQGGRVYAENVKGRGRDDGQAMQLNLQQTIDEQDIDRLGRNFSIYEVPGRPVVVEYQPLSGPRSVTINAANGVWNAAVRSSVMKDHAQMTNQWFQLDGSDNAADHVTIGTLLPSSLTFQSGPTL